MAKGGIVFKGYLYDGEKVNSSGLQVSRSLGDLDLDHVLTRVPEIFHIPINENSWVLVCTDGLLDPSHKKGNVTMKILLELVNNIDTSAEILVTELAKLNSDDNSTAILMRMS